MFPQDCCSQHPWVRCGRAQEMCCSSTAFMPCPSVRPAATPAPRVTHTPETVLLHPRGMAGGWECRGSMESQQHGWALTLLPNPRHCRARWRLWLQLRRRGGGSERRLGRVCWTHSPVAMLEINSHICAADGPQLLFQAAACK